MPSLEDLVVSCLEVPASERTTKLEATCASHPELAEDLRRMFGQLARMGFLDDPEHRGVEPAPAWGLPEQLGSYRLEAPIGRGGMGVVYRARQTSLGDRLVALKLLRPDLVGSRKAQARFVREALLASRLDHPNVCGVYEVGQHDGLAWLAMPFLAGQTLSAGIAEARDRRPHEPRALPRLRPGEAASVEAWLAAFVALGRGLAHAHERGLLHRDVKPANVMVLPSGDPVLLDFGLAREADPGSRLTLSQDLVGTPAYMAPEQAAQRGDVDARADVYGLGASLYECLTLELPHPAPTREAMLLRIVQDAAPDARRSVPWLPRPVADVVRGALEPDPARRYQTAAAFADDLQRVLDRRPVAIRRPSWGQRATFWVRRNPWPAVAGGILGLAALAALLLAAAAQRAARRSHAGDLLGQSLAAMSTDELQAHRLALAADRTHSTLRTRDQLHRTMRTMRLVASVPVDSLATLALAFDPSGRRLIAVYPSSIAVLSVGPEDRPRVAIEQRIATPQSAQAVVVGTGGGLVFLGGQDGVLRRWQPGGGLDELAGRRPVAKPSSATFTCAAADVERGLVYFGDTSGSVHRIALATAAVEVWDPAAGLQSQVDTCTVLAEGWVATTRWAGGEDTPASELVARRDDQVLGPFRLPGRILHAAACASGQRLWVARARRGLSLFDLGAGSVVETAEYPVADREITALASGPSFVYAGCVDGTVHRLSHDASRPPLVVRRHGGTVDPIRVEPGTDNCVSCGNKDMSIQIADPGGRPLEPPLRGSNSAVFDVALDPQGKLLAASTWSGRVQIMRRGDPTPSLQHPAGPHFDGFQFAGSSGWVVIASSEKVAYRGHPDTRTLESPGEIAAKGSRRPPPGALSVPLLAVAGDRLARGRLRYLSIHDASGSELASVEVAQPIYGVDFLADDLVWVALNGGPLRPPRFQTYRLVADERQAGWRLELTRDVAVADTWAEQRYFWQRVIAARDGSFFVACCNDRTVRVYAPDGRRIGEPLSHAAGSSTGVVRFAAVSPDGTRLVSSGSDGRVKWWRRLADGTWGFDGRVTELPTDAGFVSFDAKGQRIAMTCHSGVVRVLDLEGRLLEEFHIDSWPLCCRFSPDGRRLGATTDDGRFVTWFLDHAELRQRAEALLPFDVADGPAR